MENSTLDNNFNTTADLQIDDRSRDYLTETAKWAKFLSIMGFIGAALMAVLGLFMGSLYSLMGDAGMQDIPGFPMWMMSAFYFLIALLYIMPMLYMYRFSTKVKTALFNDDQEELTASFKNLKSLFKFVGISTIIFLAFYFLMLVFVVFAGVMAF